MDTLAGRLDVDPLVADEVGTVRHERQDRLGLAALGPAGDHDAHATVDEGRRVQRQRTAAEHGQVQARDQQGHGGQAALAHDLGARGADVGQRDLDPRPGLVLGAQDQERVVGVARVIEAEQRHRAVELQPVDETDDEVGSSGQRAADRPELPVDGRHVARIGVEQADAGEAVQVVVDGGRRSRMEARTVAGEPKEIDRMTATMTRSRHADIRRADWRFLLPDPDLGRVAYPAPRHPDLLGALGEVSAVVERAPVSELEGFDVVVVTGDRHSMQEAADNAPPGAWLVAEAGGFAAVRMAARLRRRGFQDVAAHWMWPDAERCKEIVPMRPAALRHALDRRDPGAALRLRVRLARTLARTPLFALVVDHAVVVARVPS